MTIKNIEPERLATLEHWAGLSIPDDALFEGERILQFYLRQTIHELNNALAHIRALEAEAKY